MRDPVLEKIDALGERLCCYSGKPWPHRTCDCKYPPPSPRHWSSEVTGCPELRDIRKAYLKAYSVDWREWLRRKLA